MAYKQITLSDGLPCRVRQLGLFELNGKGRDIIGPFKYTLLLATGQLVEDEYDLRALDYTPQPPDKPVGEIENGSLDWYDLQEYETFQCSLAWEKKRIESYEGYVNDIINYILENCLAPEDKQRLVSIDDWDAVYNAALVPELTVEGVAACLRNTFYGYLRWAGNSGRPFWHLKRKESNSGVAPVGNGDNKFSGVE